MINQKRLIDTFINLVKIDSPTGEEEVIANYVRKLFEKKDLKVFQDKLNNVIVKIPGKGEPLLLSAHLDTVEPGRNIKPQIHRDKITSDGKTILGADDKVAVAAIIEVVSVILEKKLELRPLEIVFTTSEESGSYGVDGLDYKKISAKSGYLFDMSLPIGTIITASPYYDRFDIEVIGKSSHASLPQHGINAISILRDALKELEFGRITKNTFINIGIIEGGDARNTVPGRVKVRGEVRSFLEVEQNRYIAEIINVFKKTAAKYDAKVKYDQVRENLGYKYSANYKLIKNVTRLMLKEKIKPVLQEAGGCSDANVFIAKGVNVLNLGNGARNAHTIREEIAIGDLTKLSKLILSLSTV